MKHAYKRSRKPMWLLYVAMGIALGLLLFALIRFVILPIFNGSPDDPNKTPIENNGDDNKDPALSGDELDQKRSEVIEKAEALALGYYYDEAIALLNEDETLKNEVVEAKITEYQNAQNALVKYTDRYYHVFFHSLVVDNSKAFDGDSDANGYNMYMTTVPEFKKMIQWFYDNDFVLVDITSIYDYKDGKPVAKDVYLPAGKKALIISQDDVNYYDYMADDGFATRLDLDENGRVVGIVKDDNGVEHVDYEGDMVPILDTFVAEHPDFSYRGAKGIIALTGYAGAYGYRITDLDWFTKDEQEYILNQVKKISQTLRDTGWQIASHSYTHNQYWNKKTITQKQLEYDTGRWLNEIMPYVGETHIFISPFGVSFNEDNFVAKYLIEKGFYIYCPVGSGMTTVFEDTRVVQERLNLDGITMFKYPERISKYFFDPKDVIDPDRPPLN